MNVVCLSVCLSCSLSVCPRLRVSAPCLRAWWIVVWLALEIYRTSERRARAGRGAARVVGRQADHWSVVSPGFLAKPFVNRARPLSHTKCASSGVSACKPRFPPRSRGYRRQFFTRKTATTPGILLPNGPQNLPSQPTERESLALCATFCMRPNILMRPEMRMFLGCSLMFSDTLSSYLIACYFLLLHTIQYDTIRYGIFTCAQKLMKLPAHVHINEKIKKK